jgi:hypothetical protein
MRYFLFFIPFVSVDQLQTISMAGRDALGLTPAKIALNKGCCLGIDGDAA